MRYNSSGGYSVKVLWHKEEDRELTPAEAVQVASVPVFCVITV